jgi:uncharacterized membrane protein
MNVLSKLVYTLGGYDYRIIEKIKPITNHYHIKYIVPGYSLLLIFLITPFGGWHLTGSILDPSVPWFVHAAVTFIFSLVIFSVDFMLMQAGKTGMNWLRYLLAVSLGTLISILTTLAFFQKTITANLKMEQNQKIAQLDSVINIRLKDKETELLIARKKVEDRKDSLDNEAKGRSASGKPGEGPAYRSIKQNYIRDSLTVLKLEGELVNVKTEVETQRNLNRKDIASEYSDDILVQLKHLVKIARSSWMIIGFAILFIGCFIAVDLIALTTKGMKDNPGPNDPYKTYIDSLIIETTQNVQKIDFVDIEAYQKMRQNEAKKFNEDMLHLANVLYSCQQHIALSNYFEGKEVPKEIIDAAKKYIEEQKNKHSS